MITIVKIVESFKILLVQREKFRGLTNFSYIENVEANLIID